ncbi:hypothetical protein HAX54_033761, partial [Datura stramonium]|nr:hypothetical protein [Datura stramonium]
NPKVDHPLEENSNNDDDEILDSATPLNQREQDFSNPRVSNWKHRASHPLDNIISSFDQGIITRSQ